LECKFYKNEEIWKLFKRLMFCQSGRRHAHHRDLKTKKILIKIVSMDLKSLLPNFDQQKHCVAYHTLGN
jgi:hypothetical protein